MNDTRDVDAAEWLHQELGGALNKVAQRQGQVDRLRFELHMANTALGEAFAKADAIRLIISMAPLPLIEAKATLNE